jgi:hypothetical protein
VQFMTRNKISEIAKLALRELKPQTAITQWAREISKAATETSKSGAEAGKTALESSKVTKTLLADSAHTDVRSAIKFAARSSPDFQEASGITKAILIPHQFAPDPSVYHNKNRQSLHTELTKLHQEGKLSDYEFNTIRQVNNELDKVRSPLGNHAKQAIIEAIETMHDNDYLLTESPLKWFEKKVETEQKISNSFSEEGSNVGKYAHQAKPIIDSLLEITKYAVLQFLSAEEEKIQKHVVHDFKKALKMVQETTFSSLPESPEDQNDKTPGKGSV